MCRSARHDPHPAVPITQSSGKDGPKRINRSGSAVARSRLEGSQVWHSLSAMNRPPSSLSFAPISGVASSQQPRGGNWEASAPRPNYVCQIRREERVVP